MKRLLITSSVNVIANDSNFANIPERERQTYLSINKLIDKYDIVYVVDGSGFNFEKITFHIDQEKLSKIKLHSFIQDLDLVKKKGKALGELMIYEEFIRIYGDEIPLNCELYKISGRWFVNNIQDIEKKIYLHSHCFFQYYPKFFMYRKYIQTCFFKTTINELQNITKFGIEKIINSEISITLEEIFSLYLSKKSKKYINMEYPNYFGVTSGSTGFVVKMNFYYPLENLLSVMFKQYTFTIVD